MPTGDRETTAAAGAERRVNGEISRVENLFRCEGWSTARKLNKSTSEVLKGNSVSKHLPLTDNICSS